MVDVLFSKRFKKILTKIQDSQKRDRIISSIQKIAQNPELGKPMKYARKGTREVYVGSFRLAYTFDATQNIAIILNFDHKDDQ